MAEFPALPLFTDAYLGDTTHLSTIEHGAYLLLLMVAWRTTETRLPDDDRLLARYTRLTAAQWKRMRPVISDFFVVRDGHWIQKRLSDEAVVVRQLREKQAANGRLSALKRKGRHSTERQPSDSQASTPTPTPLIEEEVSLSLDVENARAQKPAVVPATMPDRKSGASPDAGANPADAEHRLATACRLTRPFANADRQQLARWFSDGISLDKHILPAAKRIADREADRGKCIGTMKYLDGAVREAFDEERRELEHYREVSERYGPKKAVGE